MGMTLMRGHLGVARSLMGVAMCPLFRASWTSVMISSWQTELARLDLVVSRLRVGHLEYDLMDDDNIDAIRMADSESVSTATTTSPPLIPTTSSPAASGETALATTTTSPSTTTTSTTLTRTLTRRTMSTNRAKCRSSSSYRRFSSPRPPSSILRMAQGRRGSSPVTLTANRDGNGTSGSSNDRLSVVTFREQRDDDDHHHKNQNNDEGEYVEGIQEISSRLQSQRPSHWSHGRRRSSLLMGELGIGRSSTATSSPTSPMSTEAFAMHLRHPRTSLGQLSRVESDEDEDSVNTRTSRRSDQETLKLHKEVLEQTRYQLWPLDKKVRIVRQAKEYLRRHEDELEEKYAHKWTVSGFLQHFQLIIIRLMQLLWRFVGELASELIPWQQRIKDIESHFGSVVSSYFVFLRWIFWMNVVITCILTIFVILPEILSSDVSSGARKKLLPVEELYAYNLKVLWDFEGVLRYSPIFYGFYSDKSVTKSGYPVPLAFFCAGMAVYVFSFTIILKKMAYNSKQSKLSEKGDECVFTWKLYTTWDYGIANVETAHNKVASVVMGFRESLVEELERTKLHEKSWRLICKRLTANLLVLMLLISASYAVVVVVKRSAQSEAENSWYRQNEITIIMSMISIITPNFFELIGLLEQYHPRKAMRWMLARIMALNLLSLYTLIFALFGKTDGMISALAKMEQMKMAGVNFGLDDTEPRAPSFKDCFRVPIPCTLITQQSLQLEEHELQPLQHLVTHLQSAQDPQSFMGPTNNMTLVNDTQWMDTRDSQGNMTTLAFFNTSSSSTTMRPARKAVESCDECLSRCGYSCLDVCRLSADCDTNFPHLPSSDKLTRLVMSVRAFLNATTTSTPKDDFDVCHTCVFSNDLDPDVVETVEDVVDEQASSSSSSSSLSSSSWSGRSCWKEICRRRYYSARQPSSVLPPPETCASAANRYLNDLREKLRLRKLCWETMFGQELVKLTVMDTIFTLMSMLIVDFLRSLFLRFVNPYWFWDLERTFPKYPDFKVAENILHLVNNQGMIWMGLFMAPALPAINLVKLAIIMYARSFTVMTTNVPHETVFRASRSNNFYFVLLLMMLFLCTLPVAYTIVWLKPSWHCGPFSRHERMYKVLTEKLFQLLPKELHGVLLYLTSPGVVIPVFVLMILVIYYLISLTGLLRESNEDLKNQLMHERTEERRKLLQTRQVGSAPSTAQERWKRLLGSAINSARESTDQGLLVLNNKDDTTNNKDGDDKDNVDNVDKKKELVLPTVAIVHEDGVRVDNGTDTKKKTSLADLLRSRLRRREAVAAGEQESRQTNAESMRDMTKMGKDDHCDSDNEEDGKSPPKIWISKSASMEEDGAANSNGSNQPKMTSDSKMAGNSKEGMKSKETIEGASTINSGNSGAASTLHM